MMKDKKRVKTLLINVLIAGLAIVSFWYTNQEPLKESAYDVEVTDEHVIIDLEFTVTNKHFSKRYAVINYQPFIHNHAIDIVEIDPKLLGANESLHGSHTIYLNKENMSDATIKQLINKDISPIQSVTLGKRHR